MTDARSAAWEKYLREAREEKDRDAWKKILATEEGRWILMRILDRTNYRARVMTGNSFTYFNEGMREVGIQLIDELAGLLGYESVEIRQQAEREYIQFSMKQEQIFEGGNNG